MIVAAMRSTSSETISSANPAAKNHRGRVFQRATPPDKGAEQKQTQGARKDPDVQRRDRADLIEAKGEDSEEAAAAVDSHRFVEVPSHPGCTRQRDQSDQDAADIGPEQGEGSYAEQPAWAEQ
ncbi:MULTISPECIES: hypothetical protein [unclassified Bradyrhizobium]|uniref:hypothetical protein n=1 Tax=unclassified Bradyrhizobium TaxID=2631580 RepID=UPI0028E1DCCF|nr:MULTISPECIES: hypothetical protein [unclassified Bradyrhizobium]